MVKFPVVLSSQIHAYNITSTHEREPITPIGHFFFKLYAFILLTSTLVPGINYFVVTTHPIMLIHEKYAETRKPIIEFLKHVRTTLQHSTSNTIPRRCTSLSLLLSISLILRAYPASSRSSLAAQYKVKHVKWNQAITQMCSIHRHRHRHPMKKSRS